MMVIGSVPTIAGPVGADPQALPAEVVVAEQPTTVVETTDAVPESTEQPVDAAVVALGESGIVEAAAVAVPAPAPPAAPAPAAAPAAAPAPPAPAAAPTPPAAVPTPAAVPAQKVAPIPTAAPAPAPTPTAAPAPAPAPTAAPTTAAPTTQPTLPPTTQAPAAVSSLTYPSFTVSGAAEVSLQFDGSSIYVASLTPQPKWVYEIEKNGPRTVEIKFFNVDTGRDREFHATVDGGRVKVEN